MAVFGSPELEWTKFFSVSLHIIQCLTWPLDIYAMAFSPFQVLLLHLAEPILKGCNGGFQVHLTD